MQSIEVTMSDRNGGSRCSSDGVLLGLAWSCPAGWEPSAVPGLGQGQGSGPPSPAPPPLPPLTTVTYSPPRSSVGAAQPRAPAASHHADGWMRVFARNPRPGVEGVSAPCRTAATHPRGHDPRISPGHGAVPQWKDSLAGNYI